MRGWVTRRRNEALRSRLAGTTGNDNVEGEVYVTDELFAEMVVLEIPQATPREGMALAPRMELAWRARRLAAEIRATAPSLYERAFQDLRGAPGARP